MGERTPEHVRLEPRPGDVVRCIRTWNVDAVEGRMVTISPAEGGEPVAMSVRVFRRRFRAAEVLTVAPEDENA